MTKQLPYITYDIAIASALVSKGYQIEVIDRTHPKKAKFVFYPATNLHSSVELYWNDELELNARTLLDNLKMLKNRLYSQTT